VTEYLPILDHGWVKYKTHWGSDEDIIEAARESVDKGFVSWEPYENHPKGDAGLLSYLWKNQHTTPFEMAGMIVQVQAPIMVFREWHRHRTQSYNEMSARYTPLPDVNYLPSVERCMKGRDTRNKQASSVGGKELTPETASQWLSSLYEAYQHCQKVYIDGLEKGIPKELARLILPVGRYSRMRASANLLNWLRFLKLRQAPNAQEEIRVFADAVNLMLTERFPRTMELFNESGLQGINKREA
jgi:thymidylate synthase (FAD)